LESFGFKGKRERKLHNTIYPPANQTRERKKTISIAQDIPIKHKKNSLPA